MAGKEAIARSRRQAKPPRLDGTGRQAHGAVVQDLGRSIVVLGLVIAAVGALLMLLPRMPWLGHLPGDLHVERPGFSVHFPLVTCLVVSAVATIILNLFFRR
jgi:DUF2905 family protein